ncbi:hypothetical protein CBM2586_A110075 [Cupriavidus phytorum]|uniref:Uncharacterized protein n=1 Tax=Cupriavidus taiwanensis TaxID=164546 RepID=A0A975X634_9BURK|nr:hypothetical protein CBM2586_A110075 [Cupriavidus taiwanensis]
MYERIQSSEPGQQVNIMVARME